MMKDSYYAAASDGPHLIITQVQLQKTNSSYNYDEWTKVVRMYLRAKQKLKFLNGLISIPTDDADKEKEW